MTMDDEIWKRCGLKKTKARQNILALLQSSDRPLTAEAIFASLPKDSQDLSTVYRVLSAFEKVGLAKKEINENKENVFSFAEKEDAHVLVCVQCKKRVPLDGCPFELVNQKIEQETGFLIPDQNREIYGLCPECQKKTNGNRS